MSGEIYKILHESEVFVLIRSLWLSEFLAEFFD